MKLLNLMVFDCNRITIQIKKTKVPSTKICYKCAYEIDACNLFVEKYNEIRSFEDADKVYPKKGYCYMCRGKGRKGYIYELTEDDHLSRLALRKICEIFNENIVRIIYSIKFM